MHIHMYICMQSSARKKSSTMEVFEAATSYDLTNMLYNFHLIIFEVVLSPSGDPALGGLC